MTLDELNKKYPFIKNMDSSDIKGLISFLLTCIIDIVLHSKKDDPSSAKLSIFMDDAKTFLELKNKE